jgi:hypothetical protein
MRIDVFDEAGQLRSEGVPLRCQNVSVSESCAGLRSAEEGLEAECSDCGDELVLCRCNPGEA